MRKRIKATIILALLMLAFASLGAVHAGAIVFAWSLFARRLNFGDLANTFLGLEPQEDSSSAQIYLTPLATVAMAARSIGGFTYQEFTGPLETLKNFAPNGAVMSAV